MFLVRVGRGTVALRPPTFLSLRSAPNLRKHGLPSKRSFSSSTMQSTESTSPSPVGAIGSLTSELDKLAPRFELQPSQLTILTSPDVFYSTLKQRILKAKERVFLSTLYIGKAEHELIETIGNALRTNPNLKVSVLTDALRGTREEPRPTTASLLVPLVKEFGSDRVDIRLFHTPNLKGLKKKLIPRRLNEGFGLQHMKLYGFDDEIMLSGANLSEDYFTNRQDRYHIFSSKEVTDYYYSIHKAVSSLSFRALPADTPSQFVLDWPTENPAPSPIDHPHKYKKVATKVLGELLTPSSRPKPIDTNQEATYLYPVSQFTPIVDKTDPSTELPALKTVLSSLFTPGLRPASWTFTAGYFNVHPTISELLRKSAEVVHSGTIITASPEANGFLGSKGMSGYLPAGYTMLSLRFLRALKDKGSSIQLREWRNGIVNTPGGWSYHAKGIWLAAGDGLGKSLPLLTVIGSSNYTRRSYGLDIECGAIVVSNQEKVRSDWRMELDNLLQHTNAVTAKDLEREERGVRDWRMRLLLWLFGSQM